MSEETCKTCRGRCEIPCAGCGGNGEKSQNNRDSEGRDYKSWSSCANCNGRGSISCPRCNGTGKA